MALPAERPRHERPRKRPRNTLTQRPYAVPRGWKARGGYASVPFRLRAGRAGGQSGPSKWRKVAPPGGREFFRMLEVFSCPVSPPLE